MKVTTSKIDIHSLKTYDNPYNFTTWRDDNPDLFYGMIHIDSLGSERVIEEWEKLADGHFELAGRLDILQSGSAPHFYRKDLDEFIATLEDVDELDIRVYYLDASYPEVDYKWDKHTSLYKQGQLTIDGVNIPGCFVWSSIQDGDVSRYVTHDNNKHVLMTQVMELWESGCSGIALEDHVLSFEIDEYHNDQPTYLLEDMMENVEDEGFKARVMFTHGYFELMADGYLDLDIKTVIGEVEKFYRITLGTILTDATRDYVLLIKLAMGENTWDQM